MAKTSTKKYLRGSAKTHTFSNGGDVIHLDLNLQDVNNLPVTKTGYVKLTLSRRKEVDKFGNEFSIYENDFKPTPKDGSGSAKPAAKPSGRAPGGFSGAKSDLPF